MGESRANDSRDLGPGGPAVGPTDSMMSAWLSERGGATLCAVNSEGKQVALPDEFPIPVGCIVDSQSTLGLVVPHDLRTVTDAFVSALQGGSSNATVHLASDPATPVRLDYLDLRARFGILLRALSRCTDTTEATPTPATTERVAAQPRLGTMIRDEVGTIRSIDAATSQILGWLPEDLSGRSSLDYIHPDDHAKAIDNWMARLARADQHSTRTRAVRLRYRHKDGHWVWLETTNEFVVLPDGSTASEAQLIDVSAEMDALDALRRSQDETAEAMKLLDTFESLAPIGFAYLDPDLHFSRVNATFAAMTGLDADALLGRVPADVEHDMSRWAAMFEQVVDRLQPLHNAEVTLVLPGAPTAATYLLSAYPIEVDHLLRGFGLILVDITQRKEAEERQRLLTRATVEALSNTVDSRDPYTAGHQRGVAQLAEAIAAEVGIDDSDREGIVIAASIHDIGKIAIPAQILTKPGKLTTVEMAMVRTHSQVGYDILRGIPFPWPVASMVLQHHERLDGSGYPNGICGDAIHLCARVISVADVVDAMAAHRPYRPAPGIRAALAEIEQGSGRLYDPAAADACLRLFKERRFVIDAA